MLQNEGRLPSRVMLATMANGESPGPGGQPKTWGKCLVDDLKVFRAPEGPTEHSSLMFGIETALEITAACEGGQVVPGDPQSSRKVHGQVVLGGDREEQVV